MKILDGKKVAAKLKKNLTRKFNRKTGGLAAVLVGRDPASILYLTKKAVMAKKLGVKFNIHKLKTSVSEMAVIKKIQSLNNNRDVGGIIVQLPLPQKFNLTRIVNSIDVKKDVDGMTDGNIATGMVLPATAVGILKLLADYKIKVRGKNVVLLGFTRLLNVPLSIYLVRQGNSVIILQKGTKDMDRIRQADIIVSATGVPNLIKGSLIKRNAVVVDAGISQVQGRVAGDVDTKSVSQRAKYLSPVPGGVGPMTVVSLFSNLLDIQKNTSGS